MKMRRLKIFFWAAVVLLGGAGNVRADSAALLTAVYQTVNDEYLGRVPMSEFAVWTMQGLSSMDKNLLVADDHSRVTVYYRSKLFRSFLKPEEAKYDDAAAWAKMTLKVVKAVSKISEPVKSKDFEAPDRMLAAAFKHLDANSRYVSALLGDDMPKKRFSRDYAARMIDSRILYIKMNAITKYTSTNVRRSLEQYKDNVKGIILDLRMSSGGALSGAIETANVFLDEGIIVSTRGRKEDSAVFYKAEGKAEIENLPIVILVDGGTASAAEVLAAALQEQGLAAVLGTRTFGKGTVQNVINLPGDNKMVLTSAYSCTPSGHAINNQGINPDVCLFHAKEAATPADVIMNAETGVCPQEDREDRRIDLETARYLINSRIGGEPAGE